MLVKEIITITDENFIQLSKLMNQLSNRIELANKETVEKIISEPNTKILAAINEKEEIIGILTVVFIHILSGKKARIEDLVVLDNMRGKGIGQELINYSFDLCKRNNIQFIDLTSHPDRIAANKLYKNMNFVQGTTNVYRKYI